MVLNLDIFAYSGKNSAPDSETSMLAAAPITGSILVSSEAKV